MKYNNPKVPRFYYVVGILFILVTIIDLLNIDTEGYTRVSLPFYKEYYILSSRIVIYNVFAYFLSSYGLLRNKSWGIISTIFVSLFGFSINIRFLDIRSLLLLSIFIGTMIVIIKKVSKELNE